MTQCRKIVGFFGVLWEGLGFFLVFTLCTDDVIFCMQDFVFCVLATFAVAMLFPGSLVT